MFIAWSPPVSWRSYGAQCVGRSPGYKHPAPPEPRHYSSYLPKHYSSYRLNNSAAFVPPKPKLFEST